MGSDGPSGLKMIFTSVVLLIFAKAIIGAEAAENINPVQVCNSTQNASSSSTCCLGLCSSSNVTSCEQQCSANTYRYTVSTNTHACLDGDIDLKSSNTTDRVILCVSECPSGFYAAVNICQSCDRKCSNCTAAGDDMATCTCRNYSFSGKCIDACPAGTYVDGEFCVACDDACVSCSAPGISLNASQCECRYSYNGTCVSTCPEDTMPDNGACEESKPELELAPIIAGSIAGGVFVFVLVTIAFCICRTRNRKRRAKKRRPMSEILAEKNANLEEQESDPNNVEGLKLPRVQKTKPANYTNIELQDPMKIATLAQHKEDDMNRYKRDPTTKPKKNVKHRDSGVYVNQDIVRLHRSMEKSDEPKSKRKSILAKFYSKKTKKPMSIELATKGSENKGYTASRDEHHKEAYIDMTAMLEKRQVPAEEEDPQSVYEEMGPDPRAQSIHKAGNSPDEDDLEDYENYHTTQKKLQTDISGSSDEQEDYENVQPESGIGARGASSTVEGDDPQDDYENIENIDETFRSKAARGKAAATHEVNDSDDSIEDYENATRTKASQGSDSDSLQDYENASTLKKR